MVMDNSLSWTCVSSEQTDEELNSFVKFNCGFVQNWHKELT